MTKIAMIGAGSVVFTQTLVMDLIASGLPGLEVALMAPSTRNTGPLKEYFDRVKEHNDLDIEVTVTTDRREALRGADFVIATFNIGGLRATELDYEIPMRYGVDQCIGDTLAPGGIFRGLRSIPVALELAADMRELCPNALLLNYVNPMAIVAWAFDRGGVEVVGLCHGVQVSLDLVASYLQIPKAEIDYVSAGINHMAWFLKLEHRGRDLYPELKEKFERPEYYANEKVRGEVFRHFGYFMTESTGHLSEYLPYFRKTEAALAMYCDEPEFGGQSGAHVAWARAIAQHGAAEALLHGAGLDLQPRSVEYGSYIIEAAVTGRPFEFQGNLRNGGMISNLPEDCLAEGPVVVDSNGLMRLPVGDLPSACAALNLTNINAQRLTVEAGMTGDPEAIVHALAVDPLTSAVLTLAEIRSLATDMLEAQRDWLPQFEGKHVTPRPHISLSAGLVRAQVPLDPALAVARRLSQLGG